MQSKDGAHGRARLKGAFKWASKESRKMLKVNPALDWETPRPVKPKRRMYTPEDVAKLESGARPWLQPVITTLAWTGMRIDELINLRWKDIDFAQRVIHIRVQEEWKPKGRRDRPVPMHPKVEAVLKQQRIGDQTFLRRAWRKHHGIVLLEAPETRPSSSGDTGR